MRLARKSIHFHGGADRDLVLIWGETQGVAKGQGNRLEFPHETKRIKPHFAVKTGCQEIVGACFHS